MLSLLMLMVMNFFMLNFFMKIFFFFFIFMYFIMKMFSIWHFFFMSNNFMFDNMNYMLIMLSMWISILMYMAMFKMIKNMGYMFCVNIMLMFLVICYSAMNLMMFYIFFELSLIPMIVMIFIWGNQPERLSAGIYMLMYTLFGSLPLLMGLLVWSNYNSLSFLYLNFNLNYLNKFYILIFMIAFLIKMPMYLFHLWLPKAHVEAPVSGSMLLAGVLLKLGSYGLMRIFMLFNNVYYIWDIVFFSVSLLGAIFVSFICLRQIDIKSLIAYSSISHMSLIIMSFMCGFYWSSWGIMLMMLGHGLCSSNLFYMSNIYYERFYTRNMMLLKGMMMIFPSLSYWWFMMIIINMSAPPFMSLFSEILLMGSIIKWSLLSFFFLILISFFNACYSLYLYSFIQHGKSIFSFSINNIMGREYLLIWMHFFPLIFFFLKSEIFIMWV